MENKIIIKKGEVGAEYLEALKKVLEVRKQRFKIYGNSFLDDSIGDLIVYMRGKLHRFDVMEKLGTQNNKYEQHVDQILDSINYGLFILAKLEAEHGKDRNL